MARDPECWQVIRYYERADGSVALVHSYLYPEAMPAVFRPALPPFEEPDGITILPPMALA